MQQKTNLEIFLGLTSHPTSCMLSPPGEKMMDDEQMFPLS